MKSQISLDKWHGSSTQENKDSNPPPKEQSTPAPSETQPEPTCPPSSTDTSQASSSSIPSSRIGVQFLDGSPLTKAEIEAMTPEEQDECRVKMKKFSRSRVSFPCSGHPSLDGERHIDPFRDEENELESSEKESGEDSSDEGSEEESSGGKSEEESSSSEKEEEESSNDESKEDTGDKKN
ncbi:hypothetical protein MMC10_003253 [Thelotrema lepadinum]|nr:hypothetical protein [Thelotrema lepadinum]